MTAHLIYEPHALRRSDDPSILGNVVLMSLINEHSDLGHQFFTKRQNELYSVPNVSSLKVQLMHQLCFLIKNSLQNLLHSSFGLSGNMSTAVVVYFNAD